MPTATYIALQRAVDDEINELIRKRVEPWMSFNVNGINIERANGTVIAYQGIAFEHTARNTFWDGFIQPYLERLAEVRIEQTAKLAREHLTDVSTVLNDLAGMLQSGANRVFQRMADIDQRLRGNGYPESVQRMPIKELVATFSAYVATLVDAEYGIERMHARTMLFETAEKGSALVDTFGTWMTAGFAAFVALVLTNQESLKSYLSPTLVAGSLVALAALVFLCVVQKGLAIWVAALSAGNAVGRSIAQSGPAISNMSIVVETISSAALPPLSWWIRRKLTRATNSGDITSDAKAVFRLAQLQSFLVVTQTALILVIILWMSCEAAS